MDIEINYKTKYLSEVNNTDVRVIMHSWRERYALTYLFEKMNEKAGYVKFELESTAAHGFDKYDAILIQYNKEGEIKDVYIVEAKIRTEQYKSYSTLFFEHTKNEALKSCTKDVEQKYNRPLKRLYINFIENENTYIFHLDKIELPEAIWQDMNAYTFKSRSKKMEKKVYELDKTIAQRIEYTYREDDYITYEKSFENIVGREKRTVRMVNLEKLIKTGLEEFIERSVKPTHQLCCKRPFCN